MAIIQYKKNNNRNVDYNLLDYLQNYFTRNIKIINGTPK